MEWVTNSAAGSASPWLLLIKSGSHPVRRGIDSRIVIAVVGRHPKRGSGDR